MPKPGGALVFTIRVPPRSVGLHERDARGVDELPNPPQRGARRLGEPGLTVFRGRGEEQLVVFAAPQGAGLGARAELMARRQECGRGGQRLKRQLGADLRGAAEVAEVLKEPVGDVHRGARASLQPVGKLQPRVRAPPGSSPGREAIGDPDRLLVISCEGVRASLSGGLDGPQAERGRAHKPGHVEVVACALAAPRAGLGPEGEAPNHGGGEAQLYLDYLSITLDSKAAATGGGDAMDMDQQFDPAALSRSITSLRKRLMVVAA